MLGPASRRWRRGTLVVATAGVATVLAWGTMTVVDRTSDDGRPAAGSAGTGGGNHVDRQVLRDSIDALLDRPEIVIRATARIAVACLAKQGLLERSELSAATVEAELHRSLSAVAGHSGSVTIAGIVAPLDLATAERHGYRTVVTRHGAAAGPGGLPDDIEAALRPPHAAYVSVEVPGIVEVGEPGSGCIAEARRRLYGSVENWLLVDHIVSTGLRHFSSAAMRRTDVVDAASVYRDCMSAHGHAADNPADAARRARLRWIEPGTSSEASSAEIAQAVADARCQTVSRVHEVLEAAVLAEAGDWLTQNGEAIVTAADNHRRAVARAAEVVER